MELVRGVLNRSFSESNSCSSEHIELPDELLIIIFSFLHNADDLNSVRLVCRQWHSVALDLSLWRTWYLKKGIPYWADRVDSRTHYRAIKAFEQGMTRVRNDFQPAWKELACPDGHITVSEYRWARMPNGQDMLIGATYSERSSSAICCWEMPGGELSFQYLADEGKFRQLRIMPGAHGSLWLAASTDKYIHVWDLVSQQDICQIEVGGWFGHLLAVQIEDQWRLISSPTQNRKVCVWDPCNGHLVAEWNIGGLDGDIVEGNYRQQHCLFISDDTGAVCIWDIGSETEIKAFAGTNHSGLNRLVWLPNKQGEGEIILYHCSIGEIRIIDVADDRVETALLPNPPDFPSWARKEESHIALITADKRQYYLDGIEFQPVTHVPKTYLLECNSNQKCEQICDPNNPFEPFRLDTHSVITSQLEDKESSLAIRAAAQLLTPHGLILVKAMPANGSGTKLKIANLSGDSSPSVAASESQRLVVKLDDPNLDWGNRFLQVYTQHRKVVLIRNIKEMGRLAIYFMIGGGVALCLLRLEKLLIQKLSMGRV